MRIRVAAVIKTPVTPNASFVLSTTTRARRSDVTALCLPIHHCRAGTKALDPQRTTFEPVCFSIHRVRDTISRDHRLFCKVQYINNLL